MGIIKFINDSRRILKRATRPSREELWMTTKVSLLGMFLVGLLSLGIQYLMMILTSTWS